MTVLFAFLLFVGVGAFAVIHALWGLGYNWPEATEEALARSVVGDGRRRMPPAWQCYAVAVVLALVALWPFVMLGRDEEPWVQSVTFIIAGVFVARGVAGYTPTLARPFSRRTVCHAQQAVLFAILPADGHRLSVVAGRRNGASMSLRGHP